MEVPATGMGASGPEHAMADPVAPSAHIPLAAGQNLPPAGDSIAALLGELSQSDLTALLQIVEAPLRSVDSERADQLLLKAGEAVAAQDRGHALEFLRQFAGIDPARAETLASAPELVSIRPDLERLLSQLTGAAKLHAEGRLAEVTQKLDTSIPRDIAVARPDLFVVVAGKLLEAGGLVNYVRSAAVSTVLLDQSHWAPAPVVEPAVDRPLTSWQVSLRLLISIWLGLGLAAIALCWLLREDYLLIVCGVWAGGLLLLMLVRALPRSPRS